MTVTLLLTSSLAVTGPIRLNVKIEKLTNQGENSNYASVCNLIENWNGNNPFERPQYMISLVHDKALQRIIKEVLFFEYTTL